MLRTGGFCCFCLSLEAGTTVLAYVGLVFSLIGSLTCIGLLADWDKTNKAYIFDNSPKCDEMCQEIVIRWLEVSIITSLVSELLHFVAVLCLLLSVTIYKGVPRLMAPYMQWLLLSLIFDMLYAFYSCLAASTVSPGNMAAIIIAFLIYWTIIAIFKTHFFTVVRTFQQQGPAERSRCSQLLSSGFRIMTNDPRHVTDQRPPPRVPVGYVQTNSVVFTSNPQQASNMYGPPPYAASYQQLNHIPHQF